MRISRYLILLLLYSSAFAQPGPGMGPGREGGPMRARIREKIKTMKIWRLTEAVALTSEQSERFFPIYNRHQEQMEALEKEKRSVLNRLEQMADDSGTSDEEINRALGDIKDLRRRTAEVSDRFLDDISDVLSVRQRGKLLVFEERFKSNLHRLINEIRQEFRGGPGRNRIP
jgi:hypothetical protein